MIKIQILLNIPYAGRGHVYPHHIYCGQEETYYVDLPTALLCIVIALVIFTALPRAIMYIIEKYFDND